MGGWSFGTLLGPEITGPVVSGSFCGGLVWLVLLFLVSRAWPKLRTGSSTSLGCGVGGGCDGVVVWELYSGREHLVRRDEIGW